MADGEKASAKKRGSRLGMVTKGCGGLLLILIVGIGGLVGAASFSWSSRLDTAYRTADHDLEIPELTDANREEAERLYLARGCGECHGADGAGRILADLPPFLMAPPNITGVMRTMSANDLHELVRRGVRPDGTPVFFMPAHEYERMPDEELGLITAYVRSLPQSDATQPASELRTPGQVLELLGVLDTPMLPAEIIDQQAAHDPAGPDEMGEYLSRNCTGCHGERLSGGAIPGAPESEVGLPPNLTPHASGLADWSEEEFVVAMRTGRSRDGRELNPQHMPWRVYRHMTDAELAAVWAHLQTVEPQPFGNR